MASIRKRHEDFIRELQAPLKVREDQERENCPSDSDSRTSGFAIELQKELERKFDELFGSISDDEDNSSPL